VIIFGYDKWCNICFNNYISDSKTLYDRYNGKKDASGKGFKMVGLLGDSSSSEVLAAIQASPMLASWPQLFDKGAAVAWGYWNPNNVKGYYPGDMQVIVLDPEGKILYGATGYGTHDGVALCNGTTSISDIEALLDPVLTH
jgi:hypothetical protein